MASGWRRRTFNNGRAPLARLPFTLPSSCTTDAAGRTVVKHPRLLTASNRTTTCDFSRETRALSPRSSRPFPRDRSRRIRFRFAHLFPLFTRETRASSAIAKSGSWRETRDSRPSRFFPVTFSLPTDVNLQFLSFFVHQNQTSTSFESAWRDSRGARVNWEMRRNWEKLENSERADRVTFEATATPLGQRLRRTNAGSVWRVRAGRRGAGGAGAGREGGGGKAIKRCR